MTKQTHTPGPWVQVSVAGGWDGVAEAANPRSLICRLALNEPANADLIAAAPTLLKAAQAVVDTIHSVEGRCMAVDGPVTPTCNEITDAELRVMYEAARAAIAEYQG